MCGRSEVCGQGGVDVGSGSMSVLLYCIGVRTCALCVCVCVCALLIKWLYICNVLHVPCCRACTSCLGGFLVSMCAAVLLSLQMAQSGWGLEVLWCLLRGDFLYFWSYPEEVEQSKVGPACDVQYDGITTITAVTRTCACDCSVLCVLCVCVLCVYVVSCVVCVCVLCTCVVCVCVYCVG